MTDQGVKQPTFTEIARLAGVSVTTVSQVYSGKRPVSDETRRKVLKVASGLGYQSGRGRPTVGILLRPREALSGFSFGTTSFANITGAVTLACLNRGFNIFHSQGDDELTENAARLDGCIVLHPNFKDTVLEELNRRGVPTVSFDPDPGRNKFRWWVGTDYPQSFVNILEHMMDNGARRLAVLVGQTDNAYRRSILWAYSGVVTRRGGRPLIRLADNDRGLSAAKDACKELLQNSDRPDGLLTSSSVFAAGALEAAQKLSLRVPEDLMIATVMDGPLAEFARVPVTALRIDTTAVAQQVVELLELRILDKNLPTTMATQVMELLPRESTRPGS